MMNSSTHNRYPPLPLDEWEDSKQTLHLFVQIIGKIRMACFPRMNHWWHVPLYVSTRGLTTRPMPAGDGIFEMELDLTSHVLNIQTDRQQHRTLTLDDKSVAEFHQAVFDNLSELGIEVSIEARPYDLPFDQPFAQISQRTYNRQHIHRFWRTLVSVNTVFEAFRAKFIGKSTPVHLFWHHLDLVVTRFSGNRAPARSWPSNVEKEAYSHEVMSYGFWAGDQVVRQAAFYAYVYPEPADLANQTLQPGAASWTTQPGYTMAFLPYDAIRNSPDPDLAIMTFLDSVYLAGCKCSQWNRQELALPASSTLHPFQGMNHDEIA